MQIQVNGEALEVASNCTIADLLAQLQKQARYLAVEQNGELVPRSRHGEVPLVEGDAIEIVTLVGGG
jgi:sulfur carrier protein